MEGGACWKPKSELAVAAHSKVWALDSLLIVVGMSRVIATHSQPHSSTLRPSAR